MASRLLMHVPCVCLLLLLILFQKIEVADAGIAKPGCNETCGDVIIPFPFGIGPNQNCFLDEWFEIEGNTSRNSSGSTSTKPFLSKFHNIEVLGVSVNSDLTVQVRIPPSNACSTDPHQQLPAGIDLRGSPFHFDSRNVLIMKGCPGHAVLVNQSLAILAGCATVCDNNSAVELINTCNGDECCQTGFNSESPLQFYQINFTRTLLSSSSSSGEGGQNCLVATLMDSSFVNQYAGDPSGAPVTLRWSFGTEFPPDTSHHAICQTGFQESYELLYNTCFCNDGYYGNPYISNGCQVAQECKHCRGDCVGDWDLEGNLLQQTVFCSKKPILNPATTLGLSISFGIVLLVIGLYGLYRFVKRRREVRRRAKFFKRNGG